MIRSRILLLLLAGAVALLLGGCASRPEDDGALVGEPFFDELGGMDGVTAIVDAFLVELAEDDAIVDRFAMTDIGRFRRLFIEQICSVSGGPCEYTGDSMYDSHRSMRLGPGEFDALVRDLVDAMDAVGTPRGAQNRLLGRFAPMYEDVVDI